MTNIADFDSAQKASRVTPNPLFKLSEYSHLCVNAMADELQQRPGDDGYVDEAAIREQKHYKANILDGKITIFGSGLKEKAAKKRMNRANTPDEQQAIQELAATPLSNGWVNYIVPCFDVEKTGLTSAKEALNLVLREEQAKKITYEGFQPTPTHDTLCYSPIFEPDSYTLIGDLAFVLDKPDERDIKSMLIVDRLDLMFEKNYGPYYDYLILEQFILNIAMKYEPELFVIPANSVFFRIMDQEFRVNASWHPSLSIQEMGDLRLAQIAEAMNVSLFFISVVGVDYDLPVFIGSSKKFLNRRSKKAPMPISMAGPAGQQLPNLADHPTFRGASSLKL